MNPRLFVLNTQTLRQLTTRAALEQANPVVFRAVITTLIGGVDTQLDYLRTELDERWIAANDLPEDGSVKSARALIGYFRNALTHPYSAKGKEPQERLFWGTNALVMNVGFGKAGLLSIDGVEIRGAYDDDILVNVGKQKLYVRRHLMAALDFIESVQARHEHFKNTL